MSAPKESPLNLSGLFFASFCVAMNPGESEKLSHAYHSGARETLKVIFAHRLYFGRC